MKIETIDVPFPVKKRQNRYEKKGRPKSKFRMALEAMEVGQCLQINNPVKVTSLNSICCIVGGNLNRDYKARLKHEDGSEVYRVWRMK